MFWQKFKNRILTPLSILQGSLLIALVIFLVRTDILTDLTNVIEHTFKDESEEWIPPVSQRIKRIESYTPKGSGVFYIDAEPPAYLVYATTTRAPRSVANDLYVGEDTQNNLKLLHYKQKNHNATTTYPVHRIYPGDIPLEQIIADYESEVGSGTLPRWFNSQPTAFEFVPTKGLVTQNLIKNIYTMEQTLPEWLKIPPACIDYMGGDDCVFTIQKPNPYDFPEVTLTQTTGPYVWPKHLSPNQIYVTADNNIYIKWTFGDAGQRQEMNSLWNPAENTLSALSTIDKGCGGDGCGESLMLPLNTGESKKNPSPSTIELESEPFSGWSIYGESLKAKCYGVYFHPTNVIDTSAKWLLEYEYGCPNEPISGLSVWYEFDPTTDTVRALTGVMPK